MRVANGAAAAAPEEAERPDLTEVLEFYGAHVYGSGKINCIFHEETSPSLSVNLEKQVFKCFACPAAGDAWSAIMIKEDTDFNGARTFAASAGFESAAHDGGGEGVSGVLGRRRPGVSRGSRPSRGRPWSRPW